MASVFVSPGVYTRTQDFTAFASRIGITRLGLVGRFPKGPAFEAISVATAEERYERFGATNYDYPSTYVADAFLSQSDQLTITRVLGSSGFTNSPAWLIVADTSTTFSGFVSESGISYSHTYAPASITHTFTFNEAPALTYANGDVTAAYAAPNFTMTYSGDLTTTNIITAIQSAISTNNLNISVSAVTSQTLAMTNGQNFSLPVTTTEPRGQFSGSTLAILRSKKNPLTNTFYYDQESDLTIGNIITSGSALTDFTISATTGPLTATTNSGYTVSLDETKSTYIATAFGKSPKVITDLENFYVESIYPHFVREAQSRGDITGIYPSLIYDSSTTMTDFQTSYSNAVTPWIVSRVIGGTVRNLFKIHTISDGDASNRELKFSIANIDTVNNRFDLIVRRYQYADSVSLGSSGVERYSNLSLSETSENYIGRVIGTLDGTYDRVSNYITIEMADSIPANTVPAGFRGYEVRNSNVSGVTHNPQIYYKTNYLSGDSSNRTYLGVSELGYSSITRTEVSVKNAAQNVEHDLFAFQGIQSGNKTTTKGFHMESAADSTIFTTSDKISLTAFTDSTGTFIDKSLLKFTVLPYSGFDGWDKTITFNEPYEMFTDAYTENVQSYKNAVDIFESPTQVDINLLVTPDIDFKNNTSLSRHALEMVEDRADTLYIMDAPRIANVTTDQNAAVAEVISNLEATGFDSSYATTYWPWLRTEDVTNGRIVFLAPTFGVVRAIAYTDNKYNPWWAPAGAFRGALPNTVKSAEVKLSRENLDNLYNARINPIANFVQQGTLIWGQKTMQVAETALNRINIRRLVLRVQRLVSSAAFSLVFDPNDETLRDQFKAKVEPILLQIQNQRGIAAFRVVMDETNNTNETIDRLELIGKIQIQPTRAVEFIDLTFQLLPTGAEFSDF